MNIRLSYLALFALLTQVGRAELLYHDSATSSGGTFNAGFSIGNLKNAGHIAPTDSEDANGASESYATTNPATGGFPVTITLDFNSGTSLDKFYLWNHSNNGGGGAPASGVGSFSLTFYDAAGAGGSQIGSVFNGSAAAAPATGLYGAEVFDFGTTYGDVRSVVLTITDKQGGATAGFVAVREIAFEGSTDFLYHDSASTDGGEFSSQFLIGNLKNGGYASSGATEDADAAAGSVAYATTNPPDGGYPATITLEFDSPASLNAFHLWNHSNSGSAGAINQGVDAFTLTFYDGAGGSGSQIGSSFSGNASTAPATGTYGAETFDFGTTYEDVRSVVFTADNHQPSAGFVAMREIGFQGSVTPGPLTTEEKVIVYLVGGQSNADGYGVTSQLSSELQMPQPDIDFYHSNAGGSSPLLANQWILLQPGSGSKPGNAGGFGPELNFGIGIHEALGSEGARIAVIKHALGGSNLHTDWFPGGDGTTTGDGPVYQAFQTTVTSALAALAILYPDATIQIEGMIWHQGEGDAGSTANAAAYQANLTNLIADLRATANIGSALKFGIAQLSDNQTALNPTQLTTVKAAQAAVAAADPLNYLVTSDDLSMGGSSTIHFGTSGNLTIGSRFAAGMQQVPINDDDGNGLDDDWEELYWGIGNTGQDPGGNDDQDPLTNLTEFLWLTDPLVANVISPDFQTLPDPTITWPSSPERRYLIEVSSDLESWQRLDSFIPGSAGATTSYVIPAGPAAPRRFYRIGAHR